MLTAGRPGPFVFGQFVIQEQIDSGRLAPWFRAIVKDRKCLVVFVAQLSADRGQFEAIAERAYWAISVKSPHVSGVLRFDDSQPPFIAVENLEGQSLRELLAVRPCSLEEACRIGFQAALGLVALHAQHVSHRGVRPENLWVETSGTTKLLQFPCRTDPLDTAPLGLLAVDYLAPELSDEGQAPDELADVYALGCTLYELISGSVPFPGGGVREKIVRHQSEIPRRLDELCPGTPEDVADLVAEMLDKEPKLRCQTASHVAHLLAPFSSGVKPHASRPPQQAARSLTPGYGAWKRAGLAAATPAASCAAGCKKRARRQCSAGRIIGQDSDSSRFKFCRASDRSAHGGGAARGAQQRGGSRHGGSRWWRSFIGRP